MTRCRQLRHWVLFLGKLKHSSRPSWHGNAGKEQGPRCNQTVDPTLGPVLTGSSQTFYQALGEGVGSVPTGGGFATELVASSRRFRRGNKPATLESGFCLGSPSRGLHAGLWDYSRSSSAWSLSFGPDSSALPVSPTTRPCWPALPYLTVGLSLAEGHTSAFLGTGRSSGPTASKRVRGHAVPTASG